MDDNVFSASGKRLTRFIARFDLFLWRMTNQSHRILWRSYWVLFIYSCISRSRGEAQPQQNPPDGWNAEIYFIVQLRNTMDMIGALHVLLCYDFEWMRITVALTFTITTTRNDMSPILIWKVLIQSIQKLLAVYDAQQKRAWINNKLLLMDWSYASQILRNSVWADGTWATRCESKYQTTTR